jgi:acyl carrier protein
MTRDEARHVVVAVIASVAPDVDDLVRRASDGVSLHADLGLDSMDVLEVVERVAARTGVRVPESAFCELETLGRFTDYLAAA